MLDRFSIHQITAPSSCCYLSKILLQKKSMSYTKVIHKKEKKEKKLRKNGQVSEILKQWVLRCPPEKKKKR
jgi:hypothetical protein